MNTNSLFKLSPSQSKIFCYFSKYLKRVMTSTTFYIRSGSSRNIQKLQCLITQRTHDQFFPEAPRVNPIEIIDDSNNPGNSAESAQPSVSNFPASESLNGISNLPANTEAMSNTKCTNDLPVTNKENISNKSGHSTIPEYNYSHKTKI